MTIPCPSCDTQVSVDDSAWARCEGCRAMVFPRTNGLPVVVAHASERIAARLGVIVAETGLQPLHAPHGAAAMQLIELKHPVAAVLDVGLPEVMSFQIIERVRARPELSRTKVVLVASVFNRTAYKRRPTSLYGADDYVEQHHVHDLLPRKLCALLSLPAPSGDGSSGVIGSADTREDLGFGERVRALSRSIAADVALYHPDEVARRLRGESSQVLDKALDEGRRLLVEMVGALRVGSGDPLGEAFDSLVAELRGGSA